MMTLDKFRKQYYEEDTGLLKYPIMYRMHYIILHKVVYISPTNSNNSLFINIREKKYWFDLMLEGGPINRLVIYEGNDSTLENYKEIHNLTIELWKEILREKISKYKKNSCTGVYTKS